MYVCMYECMYVCIYVGLAVSPSHHTEYFISLSACTSKPLLLVESFKMHYRRCLLLHPAFSQSFSFPYAECRQCASGSCMYFKPPLTVYNPCVMSSESLVLHPALFAQGLLLLKAIIELAPPATATAGLLLHPSHYCYRAVQATGCGSGSLWAAGALRGITSRTRSLRESSGLRN